MDEHTIKNYISDFHSALGRTTLAITEMSKIYANAIKHYPSIAKKEFSKTYPQIRDCTWEAFEMIGNGKLNAKAFFLRVEIRNEISNLPIETQNKIFVGDCPSFKIVNPDTFRPSVINVADMSAKQSKILFNKDNGHIRTIDEQKDFIKNNVKSTKKIDKLAKYSIVGNKVVIGGIKFTLDEIEKIRDELYEAVFGD